MLEFHANSTVCAPGGTRAHEWFYAGVVDDVIMECAVGLIFFVKNIFDVQKDRVVSEREIQYGIGREVRI